MRQQGSFLASNTGHTDSNRVDGGGKKLFYSLKKRKKKEKALGFLKPFEIWPEKYLISDSSALHNDAGSGVPHM